MMGPRSFRLSSTVALCAALCSPRVAMAFVSSKSPLRSLGSTIGCRSSDRGPPRSHDRRSIHIRSPPFASTKTSTMLSAMLPSSFLATTQAALHADSSYCLTAILLLSTFGISFERRTFIGKALSAPLATMALALVLANVGLIPFTSSVYAAVNRYAVSLAVPMLLYDSDLRRVLSDTSSMLAAFTVVAAATVVGTLVAYPLLPMRKLGLGTSWRVASALTARRLGGAINFVAMAETLSIPGTVVSTAIAADNVVVALYFAFLFALSKADKEVVVDDKNKPVVLPQSIDTDLDSSLKVVNDDDSNESHRANEISLSTISSALAVASAFVATGKMLTKACLPAGTSALPLTATLTVVAATIFPSFFARIRTAGTAMGILFIQLFFAASGAAVSIASVLAQAPSLFAFLGLQIVVHFGILMGIGRGLLQLDFHELYQPSNANVRGPTMAATMAQTKNWKRLVLPALLVGILGYATATGIALLLGPERSAAVWLSLGY